MKDNKDYDINFNPTKEQIELARTIGEQTAIGAKEIGKAVEAIELKQLLGNNIKPKYNYDGRHNVSDSTLNDLKETMYEQDHYGMEKYKEPLHHSYNYDWMKMFEQEIADGLKYLKNEKERKKVVISFLEEARKADDVVIKDAFIIKALAELFKGGREKKA